MGFEVAKFVDHNDRRSKTSFSYIRMPALPLRAYKRRCKDSDFFDNHQNNWGKSDVRLEYRAQRAQLKHREGRGFRVMMTGRMLSSQDFDKLVDTHHINVRE